jgi:hypothetical protein
MGTFQGHNEGEMFMTDNPFFTRQSLKIVHQSFQALWGN